MKVYIGKYPKSFSPYNLVDILCFWVKNEVDKHGISKPPKWVLNFGEFLTYGNILKRDKYDQNIRPLFGLNRKQTWLARFLSKFNREQKIKVRIDRQDTWNMCTTLAHIVLPMLKQLKETKMGSPWVADEDVPDELRSTSAPPKDNEYDTDDNHFKRWDWVLDEMIFAFQSVIDDSWKDHFYDDNSDYEYWEKAIEWDEDGNPTLYQLISDSNNSLNFNKEGYEAYEKRIHQGFVLFGKYYQNLWD